VLVSVKNRATGSAMTYNLLYALTFTFKLSVGRFKCASAYIHAYNL